MIRNQNNWAALKKKLNNGKVTWRAWKCNQEKKKIWSNKPVKKNLELKFSSTQLKMFNGLNSVMSNKRVKKS
jgi:hypothetical protein